MMNEKEGKRQKNEKTDAGEGGGMEIYINI